jgi:hypothetical protein
MTSFISFLSNNQEFCILNFRMQLLQKIQLVFYESVGEDEIFCFNSHPDPYDTNLRVMIESPMSWFSISLIGGVHISARALLDMY